MGLNINGEYADPIMGQTVPTTSTPGDLYANDIADNMIAHIAPHTHTGPGNLDGYQLDAGALNLTQDIQMNGTNLGSARSIQFQSQSSVLTGVSDVNDMYFVNGDAYINDGTGTPIRVTEDGALTLNGQFLSYTVAEIAGNLVIPSNASYNLINCETAFSTIAITLPVANGVTEGRFFLIQDINNNAFTNNITIQVAGGSGNNILANGTTLTSFVLNGNGQSVLFTTDGTNNWFATISEQLVYNNQTLTFNNSQIDFTGTNSFNGNVNIVGALVGTVSGSFSPTIANGVDATVANSVSTHVTGGISSQNASGGIALNGGSNDWITFGVGGASPRSKSIVFPLQPLYGVLATDYSAGFAIAGTQSALIDTASNNTAIQSLSMPVMHNGATLESVKIFFAVGGVHTGVPVLPTLQVKRVSLANGAAFNAIVDLSVSGTQTIITNGAGMTGNPGSGAAWFDAGVQQTLTYICGINNVIDNTQYLYYVNLVDESSTNSVANNLFLGMQLNFSAIPNMAFST